MWTKVFKSFKTLHSTPNSPSFSHFSSLRDVESLINDAQKPDNQKLVHKKPSLFHKVKNSTSTLPNWAHINSTQSQPSITITDGDQRVVIYYTRLRVVRRTYEDGRTVRSILSGFHVPIDERDVSMDNIFVEELRKLTRVKSLKLPLVFIDGKYVGGAEEIKELHESGELATMLKGLPKVESYVCDLCGGHRFVLCRECDGSNRVFVEGQGFVRCTDCNLNGLVRCPSCSYIHKRNFSV